jgi:GNAT superfamily N-acetyltransferase
VLEHGYDRPVDGGVSSGRETARRETAPLAVHRLDAQHWRCWRELRLRALAESPESFSSTYEENVRFSEETWRQRASAFAAPAADRAMFVAIDQASGVWIGCAGGYVDTDDTPNLISMWVAPEHRGRGVGRSLVEAVIDWARAAGYERLRLDVVRGRDSAVRLYGRLGFRPTGRSAPMPRDPSLVEDEMVLALE